MKISFDLDGVIANTDNGLLALLHQAAREGKPGATNGLLQYYARRKVVLDPLNFVYSDDIWHILTGRVPTAHQVTREWVRVHFGEDVNLYLVSDRLVEDLFAEGNDEDAVRLLADRKLNTIKDLGIEVHFDNNPVIIARLREAGVKAILVGRAFL